MSTSNSDAFGGLVILAVMAVVYFLPALVALNRHHQSAGPIFVIDLFLGWTLLGWVVALAWSVGPVRAARS